MDYIFASCWCGEVNAEKDNKPDMTLFERYREVLKENPVLANCTQGSIITALGVATSNYISSGCIDWKEVMVMAIVSCTFITPTLLFFYSLLGNLKVSKEVILVIDQALFSPLFTAAIISYKFVLLSHESISVHKLVAYLIAIVPGAVCASWSFWIPVRYFTLNYIDAHLHVVFGALCSFFWQMIFTAVTVTNKSGPSVFRKEL